MKKFILIICLFLVQIISFAQEAESRTGMADVMRSNGKIFVVVAVILIIFAGIILYLIRLDKKISRLEKQL